jgi:glycerol uptake facilitator protein
MNIFLTELVGMALLILMGNGVVANVLLNKSKGQNSGWIVITLGWGMAVFSGVYASLALGGKAHLNPAVTVAMAYLENIPWNDVPKFVAGQFAGAILGAILNWLAYKQHFDATEDKDTKLAVFCNSPAIANTGWNMVTEIIGTFVLVLGALLIVPAAATLGALDALPVALLVLGIGLCLGGPTGYAINPARDLGPRIAHYLLPIKNKGGSGWNYSWIPVAGPIIGGLLAAVVWQLIKT